MSAIPGGKVCIDETNTASREKTKIFGPEWTNAYAKKIEHLIGVNCETAVDICESYDIQAYPDIRLFRRDQQIAVYQGPKRAAA